MISVKTISQTVETLFRSIKVLAFGESDVRTAAQIAPFGVDSAPPKDMIAILSDTTVKGKRIIVGYLNKSLLAQDGENRLFSVQADGSLSQYIWLKADGTMEIGGNDDFLARFSELKSGFDQLKSDHNDLVNAFNTHVHATAGTGPPSTPTPATGIPASTSTASIDDAKIDEIKTS